MVPIPGELKEKRKSKDVKNDQITEQFLVF